jgi:hypothetical protein
MMVGSRTRDRLRPRSYSGSRIADTGNATAPDTEGSGTAIASVVLAAALSSSYALTKVALRDVPPLTGARREAAALEEKALMPS